jgi:hypothetical protein
MAKRRRSRAVTQRRRLGRLPQAVTLGHGYTVRVAMLTQSEMMEVADEDEIGLTAGCWSVEDLTIFIDGTMSRQRQWATYFHELLHAVHDIAENHRGDI